MRKHFCEDNVCSLHNKKEGALVAVSPIVRSEVKCRAVLRKVMEDGWISNYDTSPFYFEDLNGTSFSSMCSRDWRL